MKKKGGEGKRRKVRKKKEDKKINFGQKIGRSKRSLASNEENSILGAVTLR